MYCISRKGASQSSLTARVLGDLLARGFRHEGHRVEARRVVLRRRAPHLHDVAPLGGVHHVAHVPKEAAEQPIRREADRQAQAILEVTLLRGIQLN